MNGDEQFQLGGQLAAIDAKIDSLHDKVDALKTHETRISKIEEWKDVVNKMSGWVLAPAIGVIVTAILYLVIKK